MGLFQILTLAQGTCDSCLIREADMREKCSFCGQTHAQKNISYFVKALWHQKLTLRWHKIDLKLTQKDS